MALGRIRIDRFISQYLKVGRGDVRLILAQKRVHVDGIVLCDINSVIDTFSVVKLDGKTIQKNTPYYVMLNKPAGVVTATESSIHKTVIELVKAKKFLTHEQCNNLHIAGRLDFGSTGLVLLINDRPLVFEVNRAKKQSHQKIPSAFREQNHYRTHSVVY
jgi:16S rRNA pseudouridine516 synthase